MKNIIKKILGYCPCCGRWFQYSTKRRRISIRYADKKARYYVCCKKCFDDLENEYEQRWERAYKEQNRKRFWV